MALAKDPQNLELVKNVIISKIGFDCTKYSNSFIIRRIDVRLRATGIDNYIDYTKILSTSEDERSKMHRELTINVTNFFRDSEMWEVFINTVIPHLTNEKKAKKDKKIRVWCAGCSSGEEPISVAVSFLEKLGRGLEGFDVLVTATDIKQEVIETARVGCYEEQQFNEMKPEFKAKYFDKVDHNIYKVKKEVTDLIHFELGNILGEKKPKGIDIIFCRNTVIYFNNETKSKLYEEFFDCLNSGSFFIMGKTETLQGPSRELFRIYDARERVYLKP